MPELRRALLHGVLVRGRGPRPGGRRLRPGVASAERCRGAAGALVPLRRLSSLADARAGHSDERDSAGARSARSGPEPRDLGARIRRRSRRAHISLRGTSGGNGARGHPRLGSLPKRCPGLLAVVQVPPPPRALLPDRRLPELSLDGRRRARRACMRDRGGRRRAGRSRERMALGRPRRARSLLALAPAAARRLLLQVARQAGRCLAAGGAHRAAACRRGDCAARPASSQPRSPPPSPGRARGRRRRRGPRGGARRVRSRPNGPRRRRGKGRREASARPDEGAGPRPSRPSFAVARRYGSSNALLRSESTKGLLSR